MSDRATNINYHLAKIALCLYSVAALAVDQAPAADGDVYPAVSGFMIYVQNCAVCHGNDGRGDGPLAAGLTTPPVNLRRLTIMNGRAFPTARARESIDGRNPPLSHGNREMPVWGHEFKRALGAHGERRVQERLDVLLEYVKTLQDDVPLP